MRRDPDGRPGRAPDGVVGGSHGRSSRRAVRVRAWPPSRPRPPAVVVAERADRARERAAQAERVGGRRRNWSKSARGRQANRPGTAPTSGRRPLRRGDRLGSAVDLPVMPPVQPMLAKSVKGVPDPGQARRAELRAEVGRFPLPGVQGRRRGRAGQPQHQAAHPLLPRARDRGPGAAARAVRARRRDLRRLHRRATGWSSRSSRSGSTRPQVADRHARREDARELRRVRPARARRRVVRRPAVRRAPRGARGGARRPGPDGPCYLTRTTTDPAVAEQWFHQFEGAGLDGVVAKPLGAPYQQNARTMLKIKHERTADVVVAGTASTRPAPPSGRCSAACCSACTTTASCSTSASARASPRARRAELMAGDAGARRARSRSTRGASGRSS